MKIFYRRRLSVCGEFLFPYMDPDPRVTQSYSTEYCVVRIKLKTTSIDLGT